MLVNSCYDIFQYCYQNLLSFISPITRLFFIILSARQKEPPHRFENEVKDLTKEIPPTLIERQGYLIRQKSEIHQWVRRNGLQNEFNTIHRVQKIGDCYVKAETEIKRYNTPLVLLEKLSWNVAQLLGHEAFFSPTNSVKFFESKTTSLKDGELQTIYHKSCGEIPFASYQIDSGSILRDSEDLLCDSTFDDIFSLILIYGMYDSHNNNILLKNGRPVFFDNARILPPTNKFLYNSFGYMFPLRLELMGHPKAFLAIKDESRNRILDRVNDALSRLSKLKAYLHDPLIQIQFEALPISWFDPDKSLDALEERLSIMKKTLERSDKMTYNDLVYAIYPTLKLYTALVFQKVLRLYPKMQLNRALSEIGYTGLNDCFEYEERASSLKLAEFNFSDSLENIYAKAKSGPYFEYSSDSLLAFFSKEDLKAPIPRNHPHFKLFASIVFHHKFKKSRNYSFEQIQRYLERLSLHDCFKIVHALEKVEIADFEPRDTFEDIYRKTKEGPLREYSKDAIVKDFLLESEVNLIEAASPAQMISDHLSIKFGEKSPIHPKGFYRVNGIDWLVNQMLIPGSFVLNYKGAYLPPMPLDVFKKWLNEGVMPKPQAEAIAQIDSLKADIIYAVAVSDMHAVIGTVKRGETKYIQIRYGKTFRIKRVYRDESERVLIDPIEKLRAIKTFEAPRRPKAFEHPEASDIFASTIPGYYIVEIDEVYLPPMSESEVKAWFHSDRKEYHRLKKYKDNHTIAVFKEWLVDPSELVAVYGKSNLVQIIDSSPVEHFFYESSGDELYVYPAYEKGKSVGYQKDGRFIELFTLD